MIRQPSGDNPQNGPAGPNRRGDQKPRQHIDGEGKVRGQGPGGKIDGHKAAAPDIVVHCSEPVNQALGPARGKAREMNGAGVRFAPKNHNIPIFVTRCHSPLWLNTAPIILNALGAPGIIMKNRFSIGHAGGTLHSRNTAKFIFTNAKSVAAAGGRSGNTRADRLGGV